MTTTTAAFIIKRRAYREYDKVITLYTPQFGKIEAVAFGTKKSLSKLSGQLEPLQQVRVQLTHGRGLSRVAQVVGGTHILQRLGDDLSAIVWAQKGLQFMDRLLPWREAHSGLYELFETYFSLMIFTHEERMSEVVSPAVTLGLGWQIASLMGYRPVLQKCTQCGIKIGRFGMHIFEIAHGGLVCGACDAKKEKKDTRMALTESVKTCVGDMVAKPLENLLEYNLPADDTKIIRGLLDKYLQYHFPRFVCT